MAPANLLLLVDKMEQMLGEAHWLVDGAYSLADIAAVPFIARIAGSRPTPWLTHHG